MHRLTLAMTVEPPSYFEIDEEGRCCRDRGKRQRRPSTSCRLCCLLEDETSNFADLLRDHVAPALRSMDLNYAAFRWRTSCGHEMCNELFAEHVVANAGVVRVVEDSECSTAVLKDWKLPSWA